MNRLLRNLTHELAFRPENGPFRTKLADVVLSTADEHSVELFSESSADIQVRLDQHTFEEGTIRFLVVSDLGEQLLGCDISDLTYEERSDLDEQLSRQLALRTESTDQAAQKVVVRKNSEGMLDINQAAQRLGFSQKVLKSRIPCSDYSYIEVNGKKEIQEYFWSYELISRLVNIKANGVKPEDISYIAEECCHNDLKWAEELLASLNGSTSASKNKVTAVSDAGKQPSKNKPKWFSNNRNKNKNSGSSQ
jgi:hypothetical protein